jgi:hypothetical protein
MHLLLPLTAKAETKRGRRSLRILLSPLNVLAWLSNRKDEITRLVNTLDREERDTDEQESL